MRYALNRDVSSPRPRLSRRQRLSTTDRTADKSKKGGVDVPAFPGAPQGPDRQAELAAFGSLLRKRETAMRDAELKVRGPSYALPVALRLHGALRMRVCCACSLRRSGR